jgi:hypothetical protein
MKLSRRSMLMILDMISKPILRKKFEFVEPGN